MLDHLIGSVRLALNTLTLVGNLGPVAGSLGSPVVTRVMTEVDAIYRDLRQTEQAAELLRANNPEFCCAAFEWCEVMTEAVDALGYALSGYDIDGIEAASDSAASAADFIGESADHLYAR